MLPYFLSASLGAGRRGGGEPKATSGEGPHILLFVICLGLGSLAEGLTMQERTELVRKFKYYHKSVRPSDRYNMVETVNGTYFNLDSEVELLQSKPVGDRLQLEISLAVHYFDNRLVLRELSEVIAIPSEFVPWLPQIHFSPPETFNTATNMRTSIFLDPRRGQVTHVFALQHGWVQCVGEEWKHPFERSHCTVEFSTGSDERIFLRSIRDLRSDGQVDRVGYRFEEWPELRFNFSYRQTHWFAALANFYLPSLLIFTAALLAQLKRRKTQVSVTLFSLLALIVIQQISAVRIATAHNTTHVETVTLKDVWLCGLLLHLICILAVDLLLPSRRIVYSEVPIGDEDGTIEHDCRCFTTEEGEEGEQRRFEDNGCRSGGVVMTEVRPRSRVAPPILVRIFDDSDLCEGSSTTDNTLGSLPRWKRPAFSPQTAGHDLRATSIDEKAISNSQRRKRLVVSRPHHSSSTLYDNLNRTLVGAAAELQRTSPHQLPWKGCRSPPVHSLQFTAGRKKRLALTAILICYTAFLLSYLALILYAIST